MSYRAKIVEVGSDSGENHLVIEVSSVEVLRSLAKHIYDDVTIEIEERGAECMAPGLELPYAEHCDRYGAAYDWPDCLRWWLLLNRLPAAEKDIARSALDYWPVLYAKFNGGWVRCVMASRMGDIGITDNLDAEQGYEARVPVAELSEFTEVRAVCD